MTHNISDDFLDELADLLWSYPDHYRTILLLADAHVLAGSYEVLAVYYALHPSRKARVRCIRWLKEHGYTAKQAYWIHCHCDDIVAQCLLRDQIRHYPGESTLRITGV